MVSKKEEKWTFVCGNGGNPRDNANIYQQKAPRHRDDYITYKEVVPFKDEGKQKWKVTEILLMNQNAQEILKNHHVDNVCDLFSSMEGDREIDYTSWKKVIKDEFDAQEI